MAAVNLVQSSNDYYRIEKAILFVDDHFQEQPDLAKIARSVGMSPYHFHRLFKRWAGISPKKFVQYITVGFARRLLDQSRDILGVSYDAGLSGPGRLHDLFVGFEAMTPGEYKRGGAGLEIRYGFHPTPFGECLLAVTERGVCGLAFVRDGRKEALGDFRGRWSSARIVRDQKGTHPYAETVFAEPEPHGARLGLHVRGTNFQVKVWEALLRIPSGSVVSYGAVASYIGSPGASRAVARAVASNPVAYIIPCHRVIRALGIVDGYRWGTIRKRAILAREAARARMRTC